MAPMRSALLLALYLSDEIISSRMPLSSGPFAVAFVLLYLGRSRPRPDIPQNAALVVCGLAVIGGVGAWLSGTRLSAMSLATLVLLAAIWICGAGLRGSRSQLFAPRTAAIGVLIIMLFLLLSRAGWDAFSIISGETTSRPAGLFMEPSHLALYLLPLWMIAYQRRRYRVPLVAALVIVIATSFSASLGAFLLVAYALHVFARGGSNGSRMGGRLRAAVLVVLVLTLVSTLPLPISIGETPVQAYIGERLRGLMVGDDTEVYNVSSLVVLQGIELAYLSFVSSLGLGVGAGNLGLSQRVLDESVYKALIDSVTASGLTLNTRDGGILVNKIIGEMGLLALAFLWVGVSYLRRLTTVEANAARDYHLAFAATLVCLLFVRALPYFAAPACLALVSVASVAATYRSRHQRALPMSHYGPRPRPQ
jgi:hypothetical protein